jgi:hypothetical protein
VSEVNGGLAILVSGRRHHVKVKILRYGFGRNSDDLLLSDGETDAEWPVVVNHSLLPKPQSIMVDMRVEQGVNPGKKLERWRRIDSDINR